MPTNRLSRESSPYLLQHAHNPVDWYPWGAEALERARSEDKPILLSIGYSACHWCHVMERECFESDTIAALMNQHFVNIKVDREERPDLDQIYQNVAQLMTRSGGWPLTVFLTPELKPFFGGTYFPPEDRYGRPGFPRVLEALAQAYASDRSSVTENAERLSEAIAKLERPLHASDRARTRLDRDSLKRVCDRILGGVDWRNGGFLGAPKFPNPTIFTLLWRGARALEFGMGEDAVLLTLEKMASSGIYDHLGGGFHRYSVDESWSVPHFEKMLYDNALLLRLYAEVFLSLREEKHRPLFARVLRETTEYVLREMTSPDGGFYSTQDADSEGEEGKFFVWSPSEILAVLKDEARARAFCQRYGISEHGNFEHTGKTVLFVAEPLAKIAESHSTDEASVTEWLAEARDALLAARAHRVAPGRDDKILASWNGLMISGLAWAHKALARAGEHALADRALVAARRALWFAKDELGDPLGDKDARLKSVFANGRAHLNAYLDDYAFLAAGALDFSRATASVEDRVIAIGLARNWLETIRGRFRDTDAPGFFFTSDDHERLLQRPKNLFDQAIPSGTGVALEAMLALSELEANPELAGFAEEQIDPLTTIAIESPEGMGTILSAALLLKTGAVAVSGTDAHQLADRPMIWVKPMTGAQTGLLLCHLQTCQGPLELEAAKGRLAVVCGLSPG